MREFHIEDRDAGIIVLQGTIAADGTLRVGEVHPTLRPDRIPTLLEAVRRDLAEGHSGGQIPQWRLEWFERLS